MHVSLIWAMTRNRLIGKDGGLPWRLPKDMRHFMDTTMGKPVVMGRKTFQSMKAALPGRLNIVLTRDRDWRPSDREVLVVHDFGEGLEIASERTADEVMIIGGADIYALALPHATRLYVTEIDADIEGDVYFPEFDRSAWQEVSLVSHPADDKHSASFRISLLERSA